MIEKISSQERPEIILVTKKQPMDGTTTMANSVPKCGPCPPIGCVPPPPVPPGPCPPKK
jgi:hypothetical protein